MSLGNQPEAGLSGGGQERIAETHNFFTASPTDTALYNDAYKGQAPGGSDANNKQGSGDGFLAGMERAIDDIPNGVRSTMIYGLGGDGSKSAFDNVPPVEEVAKGNNNRHVGMLALAGGAMDGKAGGDLLGINPDKIKQDAQKLADGIVLRNV